MLELIGLTKGYGSQQVLHIAQQNFDGGVTYLTGQNGSGKSTLLKILAGLISFHGQVILDGNINLKKNPITYRKQVNFGEAEPRFPSFFSGWDMIDLFTKSKSGIVEDTRELINDFGMHHYMHESIGDYSAGMLKKLSIALAFIGNPKVILLDEPFITLDESALHILSLQIHRCAILKKIDFIITSHQTLPDIIPVNHLFLLENYQLHRYAQFDRNW